MQWLLMNMNNRNFVLGLPKCPEVWESLRGQLVVLYPSMALSLIMNIPDPSTLSFVVDKWSKGCPKAATKFHPSRWKVFPKDFQVFPSFFFQVAHKFSPSKSPSDTDSIPGMPFLLLSGLILLSPITDRFLIVYRISLIRLWLRDSTAWLSEFKYIVLLRHIVRDIFLQQETRKARKSIRTILIQRLKRTWSRNNMMVIITNHYFKVNHTIRRKPANLFTVRCQ